MIKVIVPGMKIPEWLEKITFTEDGKVREHANGFFESVVLGKRQQGVPCVWMNCFGVMFKWKGRYIAYSPTQLLGGSFIVVHGSGCSVKIEGQAGGVEFRTTIG